MANLATDAVRTLGLRATSIANDSVVPFYLDDRKATHLGRARRGPSLRVRRPLHLCRAAMSAVRRTAHRDDAHVPVPRLSLRHHHGAPCSAAPRPTPLDGLRRRRSRRQYSDPSVTRVRLTEPEFVVIGLDHTTATDRSTRAVRLRGGGDHSGAQMRLRDGPEALLEQAAIVSTCNRVELYGVARSRPDRGRLSLFCRRPPRPRLLRDREQPIRAPWRDGRASPRSDRGGDALAGARRGAGSRADTHSARARIGGRHRRR